jgi:hypothetical protein
MFYFIPIVIYILYYTILYYKYSFIYLYKGYASYIHISRGYVKHKRFRTTVLRNTVSKTAVLSVMVIMVMK